MNLIVAACDNMGIGNHGSLPWPRLPNESKHFLKLTTRTEHPDKQNAVIVGRKTWEIIPADHRPLKGRLNIVISRTLTQKDVPQGVRVCKSFHDAINYLTSPTIAKGLDTIWNVGGREIYALGLVNPAFHRLYFTRILGTYECDTFFPDVEWSMFKRVEDPDVPPGTHEEHGVRYQFEVYERIV